MRWGSMWFGEPIKTAWLYVIVSKTIIDSVKQFSYLLKDVKFYLLTKVPDL